MILNRLIQPLKILKSAVSKPKFLSTDSSKCDTGLIASLNNLFINQQKCDAPSESNVTFTARSILNITPNVEQIRPTIMDLPLIPFVPTLPRRNIISIEDKPLRNESLECPTERDLPEKQAVRMIVIRRRKMRRHKLRKLRKKMKYEWAKRRQRRELRKEKKFQAILISQIKEAEQFSAEKYVADKFEQAYSKPSSKRQKAVVYKKF